MSIIAKLFASVEDITQTSTNARGNQVREIFVAGDRYRFDFKYCTPDQGWEQWETEQDASYFGVWVNRETRQTLTFAEGDLQLVDCETPEAFKAEIADAERFYGVAPVGAIVIDENDQATGIVFPRLEATDI